MDAWVREALRLLGAVPRAAGRLAMKAVDGRWWDSTKRMPENSIVKKRYLRITPPFTGWRVQDLPPDSAEIVAIQKLCAGQRPLALELPERLGDRPIPELVELRFDFDNGWMPKDFPFPDPAKKSVTPADFPAIMAAIKQQGEKELGAGFDQPR